MQVVDERNLRVTALPDESDPLYPTLVDGTEVGLLVIDFSTRRRLRLNGSLTRNAGGFSVLIRQSYANCPRYIPELTLQAPSIYAPRADEPPVEPAWKAFDAFKDVVPPRRR